MSFLRNKLFRWKEKQRIPKTEWPELVGKDAEEATTIIDKEHPGLKHVVWGNPTAVAKKTLAIEIQIQIIPENSFVICTLEENRVRIFVDRQQTVTRTPHIG